MDWNLTAEEQRVLGALVEKEATTPDQYPLSINALTQACNQKSNRDPVMNLSEPDVRITVNGLIRRGLVRHASGYSGRVSRFEHRLGTAPSTPLKLDRPELSLLAVLFLRGPQTPGELRSRSQRLADFPDMASVERALDNLANHPDGALVKSLPREPGKREDRFFHCLGVVPQETALAADEPRTSAGEGPGKAAAQSLESRISALEEEIESLRGIVRDLQQRI